MSQLPPVNQAVIKKLLFFLMQVSINSEMNLMNSQNLATVFGVMAGVFANNSGELVQWLIESYFALYEQEDLKLATTEPVFQRKMVGHVKSVLGTISWIDIIDVSFSSFLSSSSPLHSLFPVPRLIGEWMLRMLELPFPLCATAFVELTCDLRPLSFEEILCYFLCS